MKIKSIRIHQIKGILYPIIDNIWRNQSKSIKTRLFFLQIYQNVVCLFTCRLSNKNVVIQYAHWTHWNRQLLNYDSFLCNSCLRDSIGKRLAAMHVYNIESWIWFLTVEYDIHYQAHRDANPLSQFTWLTRLTILSSW